MIDQIKTIKERRALLLDSIRDLNEEQLNKIPPGFNNNIIWNLGHIIAVQQWICYKRSGLSPMVTDDFWSKFKPGSKPPAIVSAVEIAEIFVSIVNTIDQLFISRQNNVFNAYSAWTALTNVEIANIDDAINFTLFHDVVHAKKILDLKKCVEHHHMQ